MIGWCEKTKFYHDRSPESMWKTKNPRKFKIVAETGGHTSRCAESDHGVYTFVPDLF